jgi:hypothetical protein
VVTEFSRGVTQFSQPFAITAGPDGNLWFAEFTGHKIGRIDLSPVNAVTINTTEGQSFVGTVATFTNSDPTAGPGAFTATIDWGDGTTSAGQVLEDASGTFYISGSHTYGDEGGAIPVTVTFADQHGNTMIVNSTANVLDAPLLATGIPVSAIEGRVVPAGTTVATFVDTGGVHLTNQYAATINWGDGTTVDAATIRFSSGNFQVVSAVPHIYKAPGSFTVLVTIQDLDPANPRAVVGTAIAASAATVADAPLTEVAVPVPAAQPKGTPMAGVVVGSFFDGNLFALPADFTAAIDWGDGSPMTLGTIAQPNGLGTAFVVEGSHTYTAAGATPYNVTVAVLDRGGRGLTTGTALPVTDAPPIASGIPVRMTKGMVFTAPVAFIVEGAGLLPETAGHFTATINWGDGTSSTGVVETIPGGDWVVGSHRYAGAGPYTITVRIRDDSGLTATTTAQAFDPPARPAGPLHHRQHRPARPHHRPGHSGGHKASAGRAPRRNLPPPGS